MPRSTSADRKGSPLNAEPDSRRRLGFALATAAACVVTIVFATVGDGVHAAGKSGPRAALVDYGHIGVWVLLAGAFGVAAVTGTWTRASTGLAAAAGILYAIFLLAVL